MSFLSDIKNQYKTLSIVGMAKNSGKTTTLNYLLEEAFDEGFLLGITSTGRDGETSDLVTGTDKPKVYLFTDTIVSVPVKLYELAEAGLEILKRTEYRTALGNILICRVAESGYVQIAGPGSIVEHKKLCEDMLHFGVDMIFIDGAIDRKSIASPKTSDVIILATGAVISRSLKVIVEETVHIVSLYGTDVVTEEEVLTVLRQEDDNKVILIDDNYNKHILSVKTGLCAGLLLDQAIDEHTKFVYIPGAFTESIIAEINPKKLSTFTVLLPDPTRIFIGALKWQQLKKKGLKVKVLNNITVAAVTVNPYAPSGYSFDHEELRSSIAEALPNIPVFDVRMGGLEL
jgi:hypothetical protein